MEDHIKCEVVDTLHTINTCYILLLLLTVPMYTMLSTTKYQNIPYLVAIVDCTGPVGSAAASFRTW